MPKFTDGLGREWSIEISLGLHKRVKADVGFDLFEAEDHAGLSIDPVRIGEVLYSILEPQILELGIDPDGFADGFDADTLHDSATCLNEALASFFLKVSPARGKVLRATLSRAEEMLEKSSSHVVERMGSPKVSRAMDKAIEQVDREFYAGLEELSSEKSTPWPVLSE